MTIGQRIDTTIKAIESLGPLFSEFRPEGWEDFRAGYNRGFRGGLFVKTLIEMGATFDNESDARAAIEVLNGSMFLAEEPILKRPASGSGLWSVQFVVQLGDVRIRP